MTKLKTAANPYTVKGYKGVLQKHKRQRWFLKQKKIVISLPVNNPPQFFVLLYMF